MTVDGKTVCQQEYGLHMNSIGQRITSLFGKLMRLNEKMCLHGAMGERGAERIFQLKLVTLSWQIYFCRRCKGFDFSNADLKLRMTSDGLITGDCSMIYPPIENILLNPYTGYVVYCVVVSVRMSILPVYEQNSFTFKRYHYKLWTWTQFYEG
jgi:hypothetical protein